MSSSRVMHVRKSGEDSVAAQALRDGVEAIQQELQVSPGFTDEVEQAAAEAAANPRLPVLDRTDLEFVTIDPPSARDLDQALHIERAGAGYVVHYAIADVMAFVQPGDPVDLESRRRGQTLYGADSKIPLHPKTLSEDAGSLLADAVRPSLLWTIAVDEGGEGTEVVVERALVRSRAKLDYASVQQQIDDGTAGESLKLLKEVGELRLRREAHRGGVNLPLPEQEIDIEGDTWRLDFRGQLPVENWNAQISLLTGFAAAHLMLGAKVGLLRTLPEPDPRDVKRLRRTARALGIEWPGEQEYPDFIRSLDPNQPRHAAMVVACTRLLRGASYVGFDGEVPAHPEHAALASEYAHVTAPLRRLVDRYAGEICVAICAETEVPAWVLEGMTDEVPQTMIDTGRKANQYENAILNLVEAGVLHGREGETFSGVVVELDEEKDDRGTVVIQDPAIEARITGDGRLPLGEELIVRLEQADVQSRTVAFRTT